MGNKHTLAACLMVTLLTSACAGDRSTKVSTLQKKDKSLSCREIQLEQNEAEFYRRSAEKNKNPKLKNLLMPLGYISTYVDAEEAIAASDARVEYLNRIYDILNCDDPKAEGWAAAPYSDHPAAPQPPYGYNAGYAPAPVAQQPPYYQQRVTRYQAESGRADPYWNQPGASQDDWYW